MYKSLIDKQLALAFNQLKDLAKDAKFYKNSVAEFDFSTALVDTTPVEQPIVKIVELSTKEGNKNTSSIKKKIIFKTKDIQDLNIYSKVEIDSSMFTIVLPIKNSGYITTLDIIKES